MILVPNKSGNIKPLIRGLVQLGLRLKTFPPSNRIAKG